MPISAAAYSMDRAYPGQILSLQRYSFTKGTLEEITNGSETDYLPYGRFVVRKAGGNAGDIELPSSAGQALLGVTPFSDTDEKLLDGTSGYPPKTAAAYLYKGVIAVTAETAMTADGPIFVRHTVSGAPGAFDGFGLVRADADSATADQLLATEGRILKDCAAGEICEIELDISPIKV